MQTIGRVLQPSSRMHLQDTLCLQFARQGDARKVMLRIRTERLELLAAPAEVTRDEAAGVPQWYAALDVDAPEAWPPPFNDRHSQASFARRIARHHHDEEGWLLWYVVRRADAAMNRRILIGNAGFTGAPDTRGSV